MPQIGFKTSFLGFKKEEVIAYIEHILKEGKEKESNFEVQISNLEAKNTELLNNIEEINKTLEEMKAKVDYYSGKEAEIEKMSVSIGTMYMVAKQNASEIITGAENCAKEISAHSKKQLEAATEVDEKLKVLKDELTNAAGRFSGNVTTMSESFNLIKERLEKELSKLESGNTEIELLEENLNEQ